MKIHALELFGYCVGFLGLMTPRREEAGQSSYRPGQIHEYEMSPDRRTVADPLVQIGVVALDYRPVQPGPCEASRFFAVDALRSDLRASSPRWDDNRSLYQNFSGFACLTCGSARTLAITSSDTCRRSRPCDGLAARLVAAEVEGGDVDAGLAQHARRSVPMKPGLSRLVMYSMRGRSRRPCGCP